MMLINKTIVCILLICFTLLSDTINVYPMDEGQAIEAEINKTYNYWPENKDKYKYVSSGNYYIIFKPDISFRSNTWSVSFVIIHERRLAKDDYAHVTLLFNNEGILKDARTEVQIADRPVIKADWEADTSLLLTEKGITLLVISAATEIANEIFSVMERWEERGGRLNFPSVINHNINYVSLALRQGINNYNTFSKNGHYVEFFGNPDYENPSLGLSGPASFAKMDVLYKYAISYKGEIIDWRDNIKGMAVGHCAWVVLFEDDNFSEDGEKTGFLPGFRSSNLEEHEHIPDTGSVKIYDHFPEEYKNIRWY
ncbi:MAG: hypothetical protein ABRQ38_06775 [Candidatus Eremiobacterota bacterium]